MVNLDFVPHGEPLTTKPRLRDPAQQTLSAPFRGDVHRMLHQSALPPVPEPAFESWNRCTSSIVLNAGSRFRCPGNIFHNSGKMALLAMIVFHAGSNHSVSPANQLIQTEQAFSDLAVIRLMCCVDLCRSSVCTYWSGGRRSALLQGLLQPAIRKGRASTA